MKTQRTLSALALALTIGALAFTATQAAGGPKAKPVNPTATPVPTAVPCPTCPPIHVLFVNMSGNKNPSGSTYAACRVFIADEADTILAGATVVHGWSGAVTTTQVDVTKPQPLYGNISTLVKIDNGPKCTGGSPSQVYTCSVLDVSMPGYRYAPEFNIVTSGSDDACNPFD